MSDPEPSKSQVKNAGKLLRDWYLTGTILEDLPEDHQERLLAAYNIVDGYRASFGAPLLKVRMGLQSFVKTCGCTDARVGQRHKRFPRIMQKLMRFPTMQLTTMQDIGGCRVVLADLESVTKVQKHIEDKWSDHITEIYDYVKKPQESGYRAIHLVVRRDDRLIEVQLRTDRQQRWADSVEQYSRQTGQEMKWGIGSERATLAFQAMADFMAASDRGEELDLSELLEDLLGQTDIVDDPED